MEYSISDVCKWNDMADYEIEIGKTHRSTLELILGLSTNNTYSVITGIVQIDNSFLAGFGQTGFPIGFRN